MATQFFTKAAKSLPEQKDGQKIYLRHPSQLFTIFYWRGRVAELLIERCGYIEITKEEYEAGES